MHRRTGLSTAVSTAVCLAFASATSAQDRDIPQTPSGHPDLSGTYDVATLTPVERSEVLGERVTLTDEAAAELAKRVRQARAFSDQPSDPNRGAPPVGGDRVFGNAFWIEPGQSVTKVDGQWRTSILIDPPNGRYPPRVADAPTWSGRQRLQDDGSAYWLEAGPDAPGPFDNMEQRPYAERCLSMGSSAGPPMLPSLANNYKRIVQSGDTIMILSETVHDARIIRMNAEHDPPGINKWLGDSIGLWSGDTLVVETTNFVDRPTFARGTGTMTVTEWFRLESDDALIYTFTVEDPTVWTAPFSGEYAWARSANTLFEHACHEGNYPLTAIMKGARVIEAVFRGEAPGGIPRVAPELVHQPQAPRATPAESAEQWPSHGSAPGQASAESAGPRFLEAGRTGRS